MTPTLKDVAKETMVGLEEGVQGSAGLWHPGDTPGGGAHDPGPGTKQASRPFAGPAVPGVDEEFAALLWRLRQLRPSEGVGLLVGVSAATPGLGATTIAIKLALQAANEGEGPVLLVDAHTERKGGGRRLGIKPKQGLGDLLGRGARFEEIVQRATPHPFDWLPAGTANVAWQPRRVEEMLNQCREEYDVIVVDLPPAQHLQQSLPLAQQLDGVAMVVGWERSTHHQVAAAYQRLCADGVKVAGTVLNGHRNRVPHWIARWL